MTIAAIALAAFAAVRTYNTRMATAPDATNRAVHGIKQSTSVVLAIGGAIYAVLDALMFLARTFGSAAANNRPNVAFGTRVAADEPTSP